MINDPKFKELREKVEAEAKEADAMYAELFVASGMDETIALKVAKALTDLTLLGKLFLQMGMPSAEIKHMISTELNNYVNSDEEIRAEMARIFVEGTEGSELFVRAAKIQNIRILEEELKRLKLELEQPIVTKPIVTLVKDGESTISVTPSLSRTLH